MRFFIILGLCILLSFSVFAVVEETNLYRIECSPDESLITSEGFVQYCSYLWKGNIARTEDVAFCFDTKISNGRVFYNGSDISNLFKYRSFNMVKGDCYYVQNVRWQPNETKSIILKYVPQDISKPKWDTYFGNITAGTVSLRLDPLFNTSLYEAGTFRASNYVWLNDTSGVLADINLSSSYSKPLFSFNNVSNVGSVDLYNVLSGFTMSTTGGITTSRGIKLVANESVGINYFSKHNSATCGIWYLRNSTGLVASGSFSGNNANLGAMYNFSGGQEFYLECDSGGAGYTQTFCSAPASCNYAIYGRGVTYRGGSIGGVGGTNGFNILTWNVTVYNKSNTMFVSKVIDLSTFVSKFRLNASGVNNVFINISFNGSSSGFTYLNISNSSWITPSSIASSNNKLFYILYFPSGVSGMDNFSISFNNSLADLVTYTNEKVSMRKLNYTINYTSPDGSIVFVSDNVTLNRSVTQGSNVVIINRSGYFDCSYSQSVVGNTVLAPNCSLSNSLFSIYLQDINGNFINSFNGTITSNAFSFSEFFNTSSGVANVYWLVNSSFNLSFQSLGYVAVNNFSSNASQYQSFVTSLSSLFNISIYDEDTLSLITQNVSVVLTDLTNPATISSSTTSGRIGFVTTSVHTYEVRFSAVNYSTRRYYVPVANSSAFSLDAYLLNVSKANNLTLVFYDSNGALISGLPIYMYLLSGNSTLLTSSMPTDVVGKVYFDYGSGSYYSFNCVSSTYVCSPFVLNPIRQSSYDVLLKFLDSTISYSPINVTGSVSFNNVSDVLSFSYVSSNDDFINYSYLVIKDVNGEYVVLCEDSSGLLGDSFDCNLFGYHGQVFVRGLADGRIFFGSWVDIGDSPDLFSNMNGRDASYIAGFILLIVICGSVAFGLRGILISSVVGLFMISLLGIMNLVTGTFFVVSIIVACIIMFGIKR